MALRSEAYQHIWKLLTGIVMGVEASITEAYDDILAKVLGDLVALDARDTDNTVLLTEFATLQELSNYLEMKKLSSLEELNRRVLNFYVS